MNLTYETAKATLLKLAAERPDYIHTRDPKAAATRGVTGATLICYYRFHDDSPGCIIGAMVAELFPDVRLKEGSSASYALLDAGIEYDELTRRLMMTTQVEQDAGTPWGGAVSKAIEHVEGVAV